MSTDHAAISIPDAGNQLCTLVWQRARAVQTHQTNKQDTAVLCPFGHSSQCWRTASKLEEANLKTFQGGMTYNAAGPGPPLLNWHQCLPLEFLKQQSFLERLTMPLDFWQQTLLNVFYDALKLSRGLKFRFDNNCWSGIKSKGDPLRYPT